MVKPPLRAASRGDRVDDPKSGLNET